MNVSDKKQKSVEKIIEMIEDSGISSIKQSVSQVINIVNDPKAGAKDLMEIIEKDPPLTARLLKLANSAYYSYPKSVNEVQEAIVLMGFTAVKELALSQKVCEFFQEDKSFIGGYSRPELWKHSNAVAMCAKLIYRKEYSMTGVDIYVAGLLHDIGIIIEDQILQSEFEDILEKTVMNENNLNNEEHAYLGFDHTDIGRVLTRNWDFPDELVMAIGYHHDPIEVDDEFKTIVFTLYVSDYACQMNNIGYGDASYTKELLFKKYLRKLNIDEKGLSIIIKEINEEIKKMEKAGWF